MNSIKILTFSSLYPDSVRNRHGIFVETRLRHLIAGGQVESKVIAPVPWFPSSNPIWGQYAVYAKVDRQGVRHNIDIIYPRYPLFPKVGMISAPFFMALFTYAAVKKIIRNGYDFDIIDAHYFYPDGVAAILLGKLLNKPVVITARGTDLNYIPRFYWPKKMIKWAARNAAAMITVCEALRTVLLEFGVPNEKVTTLRNGVDLELFYPEPNRETLKSELGLKGRVIISVGHLIRRKGHDLVIKAIEALPDITLLIAGDGEEEVNLKKLVADMQLQQRVIFLGALTQTELRNYYAAVDILVLASSREGWANVLLESMACGTPVVATNLWGTPEVVSSDEAGILVEREVKDLEQGIHTLFENYPDRKKTRNYAERFNWDSTSKGQETIFAKILNKDVKE